MRNIQHASNRSVLELQILTLVSTTDVMRTCFIERWCVYSHLAFDRHQIIQSAWTRGDTRHQSFRGQLLLRTTRERIERRGRERFQVWCSDHAWDHTHFSRHVTSFQRSSGFPLGSSLHWPFSTHIPHSECTFTLHRQVSNIVEGYQIIIIYFQWAFPQLNWDQSALCTCKSTSVFLNTYARTHTLSDTKTDIEHDVMWSVRVVCA